MPLRKISRSVVSGGVRGRTSTKERSFEGFTSVAGSLPAGAARSKLVALDLDNTLWTPELYTLRHLQLRAGGASGPGEDVWLLDGAAEALYELASCERCSRGHDAAVRRAQTGNWARSLLQHFQVTPRLIAMELVRFQEIYTAASRLTRALHEKSACLRGHGVLRRCRRRPFRQPRASSRQVRVPDDGPEAYSEAKAKEGEVGVGASCALPLRRKFRWWWWWWWWWWYRYQ